MEIWGNEGEGRGEGVGGRPDALTNERQKDKERLSAGGGRGK